MKPSVKEGFLFISLKAIYLAIQFYLNLINKQVIEGLINPILEKRCLFGTEKTMSVSIT